MAARRRQLGRPGPGADAGDRAADTAHRPPHGGLLLFWLALSCLTFAGSGCILRRRRRGTRRSSVAAELAREHAVGHFTDAFTLEHSSEHPPSFLPAARLQSLLSRSDSGPSFLDTPNIETLKELNKHLPQESLFQLKRSWLVRSTSRQRVIDKGQSSVPIDPPVLPVVVRRDHVLEDSFMQFAAAPEEDLRSWLFVQFVDEVGRDDGGMTRDWFDAINPDSCVNPEHLDVFEFVGLCIGKAIMEGCLLGATFTPVLHKQLLGRPVTYQDMAKVDCQYHKSLCWLLEHDIEDMELGLTFTAGKEAFGAHEEVELKRRGRKVKVTEKNKREYVDLLASWRLTESVKPQINALRAGLGRIIDLNDLKDFNEQELEWLISGAPCIDIDNWRRNTVYKSGYKDEKDCLVIQWFWQLVGLWNEEMRGRLLQFVTGSSKLPYPEGFKGLQGSDGPRLFHIVRVLDFTRMPQAHTCFNELILPDYHTYTDLQSNLLMAMAESGNQFQLR
eukprot:SM000133S26782  [mRNA]  locus=s133:36563:40930:- [translate_table: standard]